VRHHRSDAYSEEQVLLNKRQIYGGAPEVNCYSFKHHQVTLFNLYTFALACSGHKFW